MHLQTHTQHTHTEVWWRRHTPWWINNNPGDAMKGYAHKVYISTQWECQISHFSLTKELNKVTKKPYKSQALYHLQCVMAAKQQIIMMKWLVNGERNERNCCKHNLRLNTFNPLKQNLLCNTSDTRSKWLTPLTGANGAGYCLSCK